MKIAIVAPAHIPLTREWIDALEREVKFSKEEVSIFIVDDSDGNLGDMPKEWNIYGYDKQKEFLGELYEDFAKTFHKSSACRVFGHIVAYTMGYDIIIGLDSDCIAPTHFIEDHLSTLNTNRNHGWTNPLSGSGLYPRGFPYSMRNWKTVANMGMWDNVLDLNGKDRKPNELRRISAGKWNAPAPLPFSGMNFAITRDAIFGFLFLPNFNYNEAVQPITDSKQWKFRRIDDIWGGYIFQKLLHKLHLGVTYGTPIVYHDTVVIGSEDEAEEEAMYEFEDAFISEVDAICEGLPSDAKTVEELMVLFISTYHQHLISEQFAELQPAFNWWFKVIQKHANI